MARQRDIVKEVLGLIQQLEQERQQHQRRVEEIDQALGKVRGSSSGPARSVAPAEAPSRPATTKTATGGRDGNEMSLRERMAQVTRQEPLSVRDIVESVQKAGHKFKSADPIKSVGSYLYGPEGKKHFKRVDGKFSPVSGASTSKAAVTAKPAKSGPGRKAGRGGNEMSLRQRITEGTTKHPLSVREIVETVKKAGHKFESSDPIKSVGAYLYGKEGKKHFKRVDGKFSPMDGGSTVGNARPVQPAKAKRTMSPEARKRIAEAVRARWAKQKGGKK